ncbi:hypothetical protein [Solidesulfovibrio magneticus]|uniref:Tfp pilus assembly protein, ATPase PilM n=1 Tax=Solidesulfovibrio magneticus (strain ATCC 700980 / DSM 13731 / RS-1) TaxID=573370 RepID=C4XIZ8_SOLM1|nr:hypothetical protein [Solidesulfovibrio magneticus]BAH74162.1 hypothetical protein DMR_06710 [Solidesulfovibrio magneticus RS-1]
MGKEDKITPSQRLLELIRKSSGAAGTAAPAASNAGEAVRRPTIGPSTAAVAQPDPVAPTGLAATPVVEEAVVTPTAPTAPATNSQLDAAADANPQLVYDPYGAGLATASYQGGVSWPGFGEIPPAKPADGAEFDPAMPAAGPAELQPEPVIDLAVEATPADATEAAGAPGVLAEALPELVLDLDDVATPADATEAAVAPGVLAEGLPEPVIDLAVEATPADATEAAVAPGGLAQALPELVLDLDAAPAPFGLAEIPDAPSVPAEAQPELVLGRDAAPAPAAGSTSQAETAVPGGGLPELVLDLDAAPTMFFTPAPVAAAPSDTAATSETADGPGALAPSDTANAEEPPQADDADNASGPMAESAPVAAADLAVVAASAGMVSETAAGTPKKRRGFNWRSLLPGGRICHVGVDISATELVCVAVRGQDADFEVLGLEAVPVPQGVEPGQPEFAALLGRALSGLCLPGQMPKVWAAAQSARSNIQFLTIPKVPSRQVDNAVYWTAKKDMGFDEADVIFDFERRGEITEKGAVRLGAMAYTTPREAISLLQNDFAQAGFPLAGLTLEPFAHQNLYRRRIVDGPTEGATANLHVGRNWSRLEIVSNGDIMFVRVIKTSMSGMEQAVYDALESRGLAAPAQPAKAPAGAPGAAGPREEVVLDLDALSGSAEAGLVLDLDAPASPVTPEPEPQGPSPQPSTGETVRPLEADHARELLDSVVYGCLSVDDCHPGYGLELDDVMDMLRPVASRLVRQVEMTLKHYRESLGQDQVTRLTVSGPLGGSRLFLDFIQEHVGLPCESLDPLAGRPLPAGTAIGGRLPGALFSQALGLALSDEGHTPSAFVTYKERAAKRASRLLEQGALVGLAAVLAGMALLSFSAMAKRQTLERERDALNQRLAGYGASLDAAALARKSEELRTKIEAMQRYASRNRIVGIWEEALALAPDGVRIGSMTTECGPPDKPLDQAAAQAAAQAAKNLKDGKDPNAPVSRLIIEGVAIGDARLFDSMLASYVVALEGSPLLEEISVKRSELEGLEGGATGLRFVLAANLTESKP